MSLLFSPPTCPPPPGYAILGRGLGNGGHPINKDGLLALNERADMWTPLTSQTGITGCLVWYAMGTTEENGYRPEIVEYFCGFRPTGTGDKTFSNWRFFNDNGRDRIDAFHQVEYLVTQLEKYRTQALGTRPKSLLPIEVLI
jgi:hypothetical protein